MSCAKAVKAKGPDRDPCCCGSEYPRRIGEPRSLERVEARHVRGKSRQGGADREQNRQHKVRTAHPQKQDQYTKAGRNAD